jgi:hypothetical protein
MISIELEVLVLLARSLAQYRSELVRLFMSSCMQWSGVAGAFSGVVFGSVVPRGSNARLRFQFARCSARHEKS